MSVDVDMTAHTVLQIIEKKSKWPGRHVFIYMPMLAGDEFGTNARFGCTQILYHSQLFLRYMYRMLFTNLFTSLRHKT
jgi:hypothetical protein